MTTPTSVRRRRRSHPRPARVAAALASLALLGALPAGAQAAGWAPGPSFSVAAGSFGGHFSEAPDGSSTATWFTGSEDVAPVLQVQHARPDGTVAAPLTLGAGAYPTMATSTTGMTAVAWIGGHLDDGDRTVRVTLLDAVGAIVRTTTLATLTEDEAGDAPSVEVAVDAAGNATVVWTRVNQDSLELEVEAAHAGLDGSATAPVVLGDAAEAAPEDVAGPAPSVASIPGGTTWVGWIDADGNAEVARLTGSGGVEIPATVVSTPGDDASAVLLSASAGGAIAAWVVPDPDHDADDGSITPARIEGVRLAGGALVGGAPFGVAGAADTSSGGVFGYGAGIGLAVGPDGTVSLVWNQIGGQLGAGAVLSRFGPGQTTGAVQQLGASSSGLGSVAPVLGAAPDGSLLVSWLALDGLFNLSITSARVAPDGTMGPASAATSVSLTGGLLAIPQAMPQADSAGGALLGVGSYGVSGAGAGWDLDTFRLDLVGPALTVDVPTTAVVLTPVHVGATVTGPSDLPVTWDFGDGTTGRGLSVSHVFGGPGTYTVTASATDSANNETVVTREITVTPAPAAGPGPGTPPPVVIPPPARAAAVTAALKVSKATRKGAKVTVSGTISSRAKGKVTIAYAQKVGHATVSVKKTATVAKGRWSTTLTLPRSLSRGSAARGKAIVTVTFAGTSAVKRATAKRAVSIAKPKKAKKKAAAH